MAVIQESVPDKEKVIGEFNAKIACFKMISK